MQSAAHINNTPARMAYCVRPPSHLSQISQQRLRMIPDSTLRDLLIEMHHIGIIAVCEDSRTRDFRWQELCVFWPEASSRPIGPSALTTAGQAMNKYYAVQIRLKKGRRGYCWHILDSSRGILRLYTFPQA